MKKVMIFGTFDGVHDGHRSLFEQASEHGDWVMAVVARDETVEKVKGKKPKCDECERLAELLQIDVLDDIIMGHTGEDKCCVVREHDPDIVMIGYDQEHFIDELYDLAEDDDVDFVIVRAKSYNPGVYKSSLLNRS
ncbi:MAG: adenylyltransferase/cytidyltransferase family protein [Patescibacteria group bacterium]